MKTVLVLATILMLCTTAVFAENFSPSMLKLSADPVIQYSFGGTDIDIPVQVSGTDAGIIFMVFTKDQAETIPETTGGFLGWHYVNKVDTCVYYSSLQSVSVGANTVTWDGKDQDGGEVPSGEYTYYLWAFDNQGAKTLMSMSTTWNTRVSSYQEVDESGLPLAQPFFFDRTHRWTVGSDPLDATMLEGTSVPTAEGFGIQGQPVNDPTDFSYFYVEVENRESGTFGLSKYKWVPGGDSELQSDWGEGDGYSTLSSVDASNIPGVFTDGTYLYSATDGRNVEPESNFFIYDMDGNLIDTLDLTPWWSHPADLDAGGQMNGGINSGFMRNDMMYLNSHRSCLKQMVDPKRYLETEEITDFYVYSNSNGDYVLDHNFEETAALKWVCFDFNVGPYTYSCSADDNQFAAINAYDVGAVSFGLLAPDGTGLGYFAFAGETAGWKKGTDFIDSGTAYDGIYCDNMQTGGSHYAWDIDKAEAGVYFIGHDSITGVITSGVGVADDAPAAFSVAQNSPNPFNPTTTISFSLVDAGHVAVDVFNVAGQKVDTIANEFMSAGSHSMTWDASGISAGVYFYTVKSGDYSKTMKMTLLK